MVGTARRRVRTATAHAFDDGVKGHVDFDHVVEFHAGCLHGVGLGNGAGKAVKQKALGAIGLRQALFDQINDECVADQTARVHDGLGFQAQGRTRLDGGAQHVARRNLGNAVLLADKRGLRALACARSS